MESIPTALCPNFEVGRPQLQIIRGLPGSGKTTLAKQYPCIHLELDHYCYRAGAYRWGESRDKAAKEWIKILAHRVMKEGLDLVVSGVLAEYRKEFGWLCYWGMKCGYEVWIQDVVGKKGHGSVHGVRMDDYGYMERIFDPFDKERLARVNPYGHEKDELRMSGNEIPVFEAFVLNHVHAGLMPTGYPNKPMIDGIGV